MPAEVSEGNSTEVAAAAAESAPPLLPTMPAAEVVPPDDPPSRCANCESPLAGPFCAQCGQHVADYHRSVWRFVVDFFDNVFCWDNKILRTLDLLLKRPGWLTLQFMAGRRVRYVHPLRLFLFTSAVCLTLLQYTHRSGNSPLRIHTGNVKRGVTVQFGGDDKEDDDEKTPAASPTPAAGVAPSPGAGPTPATPAAPVAPDPGTPSLGQVFRDNFKAGPKNGADAVPDKELENIGANLKKRIDAAGGAKAFSEKVTTNVQQKLSWVALAMLPIFALLMQWTYGRRGGYYFGYLVFSLHYHTFLLLFWVAYSWLDNVAHFLRSDLLEFAVVLCLVVPPCYLYLALRRFYGEGRGRTAAKVLAIGSLHLLALFVGLGVIGATSFL